MSTAIKCVYKGDGITELQHGPTGEKILTDLPPDNGGKGRHFSPTDLLASALASCVLTIMGKIADKYAEDVSGLEMQIEKEMAENPRRVGRFIVKIKFPASVAEEHRKGYLHALHACPVHASLNPEIKIEIV